ncbi:hypothetical protein JL2886_00895 [Phaeobacter gallaeciensis]|uniref:Uncharacterized protein n=1 Tax=Phaeobacter gallaeciensis TaxID=60890 RepID=A0A1B0ZNT3_9RHOB|nr:hypothetical protein JL2886_00895 [Phaeobacter gallaeciensis]
MDHQCPCRHAPALLLTLVRADSCNVGGRRSTAIESIA